MLLDCWIVLLGVLLIGCFVVSDEKVRRDSVTLYVGLFNVVFASRADLANGHAAYTAEGAAESLERDANFACQRCRDVWSFGPRIDLVPGARITRAAEYVLDVIDTHKPVGDGWERWFLGKLSCPNAGINANVRIIDQMRP